MKQFFPALFAFALSAQAQDGNIITVNVENDAVARFLEEVTYTSSEDSSQVETYNVAPPERRDIPQPAIIAIPDNDADSLLLTYADNADFSEGVHTMTIAKGTDEFELYNLIPQRVYYYMIEADGECVASGEIHTEGQVRMIYVPGANNIRDLGGWPTTDGRRIKYGKLFRGGELNGNNSVDSASLAILTEDLEIQAEIDMRASYNVDNGVSAFGFKSNMWGNSTYPPYYYARDSGQIPDHLQNKSYKLKWKREFDFIVQNFVKERNVYYHCVSGADRTGYFSMLLEGLLGVDYDNMIKDYELTYFYNSVNKKGLIDTLYNYVMTLEGNTQQEKFNTFFVDSLSVSQENVDYFLRMMLEEVDNDSTNTGEEPVNPTTAIRSAGQSTAHRPAAVIDLWGRKISRVGRKGIVIETTPEGTIRKRIR